MTVEGFHIVQNLELLVGCKMKLTDLFEEAHQLYHLTEFDKALDLLEHDKFTRLWKHETKEGDYEGVSFSRNPKFHYGDKPVRFVVDLQKVKQKYKIVTLDAERAFHHSIENPRWYVIKDRKLNSNGQQYAEEFVLGNLDQLHKYLLRIELLKPVANVVKMNQLKTALEAYSKKWKVQVYYFDKKKKY